MLETSNLCAGYLKDPVLQDVNLDVQPGEVVAVVGPNGAGKTTLVRVLSGVLKPAQGRVFIQRRDVTRLDHTSRARFLAVVPQAHNLPPDFTVYQTVLLGRTPYLGWLGHLSEGDHRLVWEALDYTHITDMADRLVGRLSGGEQQRVLLARALVQNTAVLLLDEPTTYLDLEHQSLTLNLIRVLASEMQKAVLMVIHDLNLAALYADRVVLLHNGQVVTAGRPGEVLTEANLAAVYNTSVRVIPHPDYGTPLILPDSSYQKGLLITESVQAAGCAGAGQ
ncbi:MAG: heme ABC transporter ATP-binding protein [Anaerolineales bacterium]|nr:heme ABC transporter ATP-binding protein [Anaerolineales bacterium]